MNYKDYIKNQIKLAEELCPVELTEQQFREYLVGSVMFALHKYWLEYAQDMGKEELIGGIGASLNEIINTMIGLKEEWGANASNASQSLETKK